MDSGLRVEELLHPLVKLLFEREPDHFRTSPSAPQQGARSGTREPVPQRGLLFERAHVFRLSSVWGVGCRVWGLGFGVWGSELRV